MLSFKQIIVGILGPIILAIIELLADYLSRPTNQTDETDETEDPIERIKIRLWELGDAGITLCIGAIGTDVGVLALNELTLYGVFLTFIHIAFLFIVATIEKITRDSKQQNGPEKINFNKTILKIRVILSSGIGLFCLFSALSHSTQMFGLGWTMAIITILGLSIFIYRIVRKYTERTGVSPA